MICNNAPLNGAIAAALFAALLALGAPAFCRDAGWVPAPQPVKDLKLEPAPKKEANKKIAKKPSKEASPNLAERSGSVYDSQPPVSGSELTAFLALLPQFRAWARQNSEEAHPVIRNGKPDFLYSKNSAQWVKERDFDPARFFCVMGRMAAALVIVEEGNDYKGTRPGDMPTVSQSEIKLARERLGELLGASGQPEPLK